MSAPSESAIGEFVSYWGGRARIPEQDSGGLTCTAEIAYTADDSTDIRGSTKVHVFRGGYEGSKITLIQTEDIDHESMHIEFRADFQDMEFDPRSGVLTARGRSRQFGHIYTATINPTGP